MDTTTFIDLLNFMPMPATYTEDSQCKTLMMNKVMYKLMQTIYKEDAIPGPTFGPSPMYKVFHNGKPLATEDFPLRQAVLQGKVIQGFEMDIVHPDGSMSTILAYATPWYKQAKITGGYAVYNDVTKLRTAQTEIQALKAERKTHTTI